MYELSNNEFSVRVTAGEGFILNVRGNGEGVIHFASCGHLKPFTRFDADFTKAPKHWRERKEDLVELARTLSLRLVPCKDCGA
jgi:hypothetical protein